MLLRNLNGYLKLNKFKVGDCVVVMTSTRKSTFTVKKIGNRTGRYRLNGCVDDRMWFDDKDLRLAHPIEKERGMKFNEVELASLSMLESMRTSREEHVARPEGWETCPMCKTKQPLLYSFFDPNEDPVTATLQRGCVKCRDSFMVECNSKYAKEE